jgi:hypothetical protein
MDRLVKIVSIDEEFEKGRGKDKRPRKKRGKFPTEKWKLQQKLDRVGKLLDSATDDTKRKQYQKLYDDLEDAKAVSTTITRVDFPYYLPGSKLAPSLNILSTSATPGRSGRTPNSSKKNVGRL